MLIIYNVYTNNVSNPAGISALRAHRRMRFTDRTPIHKNGAYYYCEMSLVGTTCSQGCYRAQSYRRRHSYHLPDKSGSDRHCTWKQTQPVACDSSTTLWSPPISKNSRKNKNMINSRSDTKIKRYGTCCGVARWARVLTSARKWVVSSCSRSSLSACFM